MRNLISIITLMLLVIISRAQTKYFPIPGAVEIRGDKINGTLDDLSDFATRTQVPFTMPDGTKLMSDVYLPILQDSFVLSYRFGIKNPLYPLIQPDSIIIPISATLLQKGFQYIIYDSINGHINPNPYQLPMILQRTPYDKEGGNVTITSAMALLGYVGVMQDMRGRYKSQGVYLPLYSDSWKKWAYHNYKHVLDITDFSDPRNGNNHEDGYNTIQFVKTGLKRNFDLNNDGIMDTVDLAYNGSIGTFGASALGYNQLQAAAAHKIDPTQPGLKCLFPIVGPLEFYKSTGFHNGCLRDMLVTGWLRGQIKDTRDDLMNIDVDINDDIHSSKDYGLPDKFDASNKAIDHFVTVRYENSPCGYYPNSIGRSDMDASKAPVDINGESDKNGSYSRYRNLEVPVYNVSGWWDIFVDGSIETHDLIEKNITQKKKLQKLIIGPWAHQTIASRKTGDKVYPKNIADLTKIDINNFGASGGSDINLGDITKSELIGWFRYNLNQHGYNKVGEPKIFIPKQTAWQTPIPALSWLQVRFPAKDFKIKFTELINFLLGADGLNQLPIEIRVGGNLIIPLTFDVPKLDNPVIQGVGTSSKIDSIPVADFENDVPSVRFYVVGSSNDDGSISDAGNYWFSSDTFPIRNVNWHNMYLHKSGRLDFKKPVSDEGYSVYVHDPDNPVITVGGGNMIEKTPQGDRESQGQMNLADTNFAKFTMNREGVIKFETEILPDSICIIGFPRVKLYAKSNPLNAASGPTDCDFFVRFLDVYPDGKEFFVVEGAVNARAREFAKSIAVGAQNDNAPFSNIDVGKLYEYYFQCYPIAYTFAKGHKIKVLISSSNYPRFQSSANVPIMTGEFFRRKPSDGRTYIYNGIEFAPRTSVQRIAFSDVYPTNIELPVYGTESVITAIRQNTTKPNWNVNLYPNPSNGKFELFINKNGKYTATIYNMLGEKLITNEINEQHQFDVSILAKGQYLLEIIDVKDENQKVTKSFTVN